MSLSPLAVLFGAFAGFGLLLAMVGHVGRSSSVAPSMYQNTLSPIGYGICIVCSLIALSAAASGV